MTPMQNISLQFCKKNLRVRQDAWKDINKLLIQITVYFKWMQTPKEEVPSETRFQICLILIAIRYKNSQKCLHCNKIVHLKMRSIEYLKKTKYHHSINMRIRLSLKPKKMIYKTSLSLTMNLRQTFLSMKNKVISSCQNLTNSAKPLRKLFKKKTSKKIVFIKSHLSRKTYSKRVKKSQ